MFLCALAFASFAGAQLVEKSRTWADLQSSHPCNAGLDERHAIVMDADAADDIGGGGGSTRVFVECDGVSTWSIVSIGGGGGGSASNSFETMNAPAGTDPVADSATDTLNFTAAGGITITGNSGTDTLAFSTSGLGDVVGPASATDLCLPMYDGATGKLLKNSALCTIADDQIAFGTSGSINGAGGDLLDFRDSTNASVTMRMSHTVGIQFDDDLPITFGTTAFGTQDVGMTRAAAGVMKFTDGTTGGGAIHLNPMASPPRTCDATAEGDIYSDTSHALCWCSGSAWVVVIGAGSCA